jgi:hypothetical protein
LGSKSYDKIKRKHQIVAIFGRSMANGDRTWVRSNQRSAAIKKILRWQSRKAAKVAIIPDTWLTIYFRNTSSKEDAYNSKLSKSGYEKFITANCCLGGVARYPSLSERDLS